MKKLLCMVLALAMVLSMAACGQPVVQETEAPETTAAPVADNGNEDTTPAETQPEEITISIGGMIVERTEENATKYDLQQAHLASFKEKYPHITVIPDQWSFDLKGYLAKAEAGDLPTMFFTAATEKATLIEGGYVKPITSVLDKMGWSQYLDPAWSFSYQGEDGEYYSIPLNDAISYVGIAYNVPLFEQAGLVDENGVPIMPTTWEELIETAQIIEEKTGKIGFAAPANANHGGWLFINLMWAYGAEIMNNDNGKWTATFASEEGIAAMQLLKDMKWKYGIVQDDALWHTVHCLNNLGVGEAAMTITPAGNLNIAVNGGAMDLSEIAMGPLPAGPAGNTSQTGGNLYFFTGTDAENEACLLWLDHVGNGPSYTEETVAGWEGSYAAANEKGQLVGVPACEVFNVPERTAARIEAMNKYMTINYDFFAPYIEWVNNGLVLEVEPARSCQQYYAVFDAVLQAVWADENADVAALMKQAQADFQANYLDQEN